MPLSAQRSYLVCNEKPLCCSLVVESTGVGGSGRIKRDCEMACDEGTLETIGWENKFLYAKTLVDAVSDKKNLVIQQHQQWYQEKSDTERRLRMMLNKKENKDGKCSTCSSAYVKCSSIMLWRRKYS
mgnify:CR=1 FL=1